MFEDLQVATCVVFTFWDSTKGIWESKHSTGGEGCLRHQSVPGYAPVIQSRECKPGPFFPNPGFGFPGIPGFGSATMKPGFETRVSGLRYRELKLSNIMNEQLNF